MTDQVEHTIWPVGYAKFLPNGKYTMTGTMHSDSLSMSDPDIYIGEVNPQTQYHTPTGPVDMPPRPSDEHYFDYETKTWAGNIDELREKRRREIETERNARLNTKVIVYDGRNLDGNAEAKQNVHHKILATYSQISRSIAPRAVNLVWRDANNNMITFADIIGYRNWLEGLAAVIDERDADTWMWSWQKKADLNALTTFDEVLAFDPSV